MRYGGSEQKEEEEKNKYKGKGKGKVVPRLTKHPARKTYPLAN
jgi:hypothetical protein